MGFRVSKQQVKVPHFLFDKVSNKNQFNKQLITCHKPMLRADQFDQWQRNYNVAVTMNKQSLLLPQSFDKMKIKKYLMCCQCPADTQMALTYQKFEYTLEKEINTRKASNQYFQQIELIHIMYKLLEGCKQFQLKSMKVGDIRPVKIVKTKQNDLKLITIASFPLQYTSIQRILEQLDNKTIFYLAPQQITYLKSRGYGSGDFPTPKSEAFSLGLTILECATLTSSADLYQKPPARTLNKNQLEFRLKSLEGRYKNLPKYLKYILQWQQNSRLTTGQMWSILKPYHTQISQLNQFSPKQSDQKTELATFRNLLIRNNAQKSNIH